MKVAILGCGPAGLVAAQAALSTNKAYVEIFSKKVPSQLYGSQYLHAPIPGIFSGYPVDVSYQLRGGTHREYQEKVYGDNPHVKSVSTEDLEQDHQAWDIREMYRNLWERWEPFITDTTINPDTVKPIIAGYDLVVSTLHRFSLCTEGHTFDGEEIWAAGSTPDRELPYRTPANSIICDASSDIAWYRLSNVFGYTTVEWPIGRKPPIPGLAKVVKPVWHNCDCLPEVLHVGRYGEWRKGALVHEVYPQVVDAVASAQRMQKLSGS